MPPFIKCMEHLGILITMPESSIKYINSQIFSSFQKKNKQTILQAKLKLHHPYPTTLITSAFPSTGLFTYLCNQCHLLTSLLFTYYLKLEFWNGLKINQYPENVRFSEIFKGLMIAGKFLEVFLSQKFPNAFYFSSCYTYSEDIHSKC